MSTGVAYCWLNSAVCFQLWVWRHCRSAGGIRNEWRITALLVRLFERGTFIKRGAYCSTNILISAYVRIEFQNVTHSLYRLSFRPPRQEFQMSD